MLIDELKALANAAEVKGCVVGVWSLSQGQELQEVFALLQSKPNVNLTQTLNLVKSYHPNIPFKRTAFVSHMRGGCSCPTA
jgi:hypothetical protein